MPYGLAKFKRLVRPGDSLFLDVSLVSLDDLIAAFKGKGTIQGDKRPAVVVDFEARLVDLDTLEDVETAKRMFSLLTFKRNRHVKIYPFFIRRCTRKENRIDHDYGIMKRRVVVTGMGSLSPLGLDNKTMWDGLVSGQSGIDNITLFNADAYPWRIAGEVKSFNPARYIEDKKLRNYLPRSVQLLVPASVMALEDSMLGSATLDSAGTGVAVGASVDLFSEDQLLRNHGLDRAYDHYYQNSVTRPLLDPKDFFKNMANIASLCFVDNSWSQRLQHQHSHCLRVRRTGDRRGLSGHTKGTGGCYDSRRV